MIIPCNYVDHQSMKTIYCLNDQLKKRSSTTGSIEELEKKAKEYRRKFLDTSEAARARIRVRVR